MPVNREFVATEMLELASNQTEPSLKFFLQWAAFNALYRTTQQGGEGKAIRKWFRQQVLANRQTMAERLLKDPSVTYFASTIVGAPFADDDSDQSKADENRRSLADARNAPHERLSSLCLILYQVRNNLFHGSKSLTEPRDKKVLEEAASALNLILVTYLGPGSGF